MLDKKVNLVAGQNIWNALIYLADIVAVLGKKVVILFFTNATYIKVS